MIDVYIGLGSNLHAPQQQIMDALLALAQLPQTELVAQSSLYSSKPMGPSDQPDYVNAVAHLRTALDACDLLHELQLIERHQGRIRTGTRWGARTLDLDILLYGNQQINLPNLTVPHYGMKERNFVLYPLAEIAPDLVLPDATPLPHLLLQVAQGDMSIICKAEDILAPCSAAL